MRTPLSRSARRALLLLLSLAATSPAQLPQILSVQGRLEDPAGTPVTGSEDVILRLFDSDSGGTQIHTETDNVTFDATGLFVTSLGDPPAAALPPAAFDTQLYLEVERSSGGGPLGPRIALRAVPYALRAAVAEGLTSRSLTYLAGCDSCAQLTDADDQGDFFVNRVGPMTITSVSCISDGGGPVINLQRNDGSPADVLTSNLTCTSGGATTTNFVGGEDALAQGESLDFVMVSAGGVARRVTLTVQLSQE